MWTTETKGFGSHAEVDGLYLYYETHGAGRHPPQDRREVLGHKEVAITLDRCSHALPTLHTKAMAASTPCSAGATPPVVAAVRAPRSWPRRMHQWGTP